MVSGTPGPGTLVACFVVQTGLVGLSYFLQPAAPVTSASSTPAPAALVAGPAPCPPAFERAALSLGPWGWGFLTAVAFFAGLGVSCTYHAVRGLFAGTAAGITACLVGAAACSLGAASVADHPEDEEVLTPYDGTDGRGAVTLAVEDW